MTCTPASDSVARLLGARAELPYRVRLLFQPAEELAQGPSGRDAGATDGLNALFGVRGAESAGGQSAAVASLQLLGSWRSRFKGKAVMEPAPIRPWMRSGWRLGW